MKRSVSRLLLSAGLVAGLAVPAFSGVTPQKFNFSPMAGVILFDDDLDLRNAPLFGARLGYDFTKAIGLELAYSYAPTKDKFIVKNEGSAVLYNFDLLYRFLPDNKFVPYLAAGYGGMNITADGPGIEAHKGAFDYGVGARYYLTDDIALRGDVRHLISRFTNTRMNGPANNLELMAGLTFFFGGPSPAAVQPKPLVKPEPVPEPKPLAAEPPPKPAPAAAPAPKPVPVVVPPADSDRDGVIDTNDKCPGTPSGVSVDASGCPLDTDKDGVYDYLDKCPGTPAGIAVDSDGCPLDTDKDGVADYLDKCPGTPSGVKVKPDGCPYPVDKPCENITLAIQFDRDKADIKPEAHDELKRVGDFLVKYSKATATVEGHTDSDGTAPYNMKLSQRRADAVRKYLADKFSIFPKRITTKAFGLTKPVADNKTAAGKAKNRRIESLLYCGQ